MPNFNAFMHRRNIFRKEPDFKKLACEYEELKQYVSVGAKNKPKFDFKNPDALRALTCALLHRYFQKMITLPPDRLIPAVPQRLNYICWVEDLVKLLESQSPDLNVTGIDIGTGASCIFPILACHRNPGWTFVGVEADAKSYYVAVENVQKNFMSERIRMIKISTDATLNDILCLSTYPVTFVMCNPPFFEEEYGVSLEINPTSCSGGRPKSSANTSDRIESVVSGGEISFVGQMLEQSRHLKEEVTIYTSMLGKKQSLSHFKQTLSSLNEDNLSWTWAELCQGKTIRYAIAWTYNPSIDLTRAPPLRHGKNKSWKFKLHRKMTKRDCQLELLENSEFIKNLIARELMIAKARVTRQTALSFEMLIKTNERTWSNQRRKRREQLNKHKHQATSSTISYQNPEMDASATSMTSPTYNGASDTSTQMVCDNDYNTSREGSQSQSNQTEGGVVSNTNFADRTGISDCIFMNTDSFTQEASKTAESSSALKGQLTFPNSRKRKNPSSCSSSPSRVCPSPNDELTDDDNQSTESTDNDQVNDDSMNDIVEIKRICIKDPDDCESMDDIYEYLLCCRVVLLRVCHDLYFELKLEHPCTAASDAYDLFLYFRNKLSEK